MGAPWSRRTSNCLAANWRFLERALLAWLEPLLPAIVRQLEQGDRMVEVR